MSIFIIRPKDYEPSTVKLDRMKLTIGRSSRNDICISDPFASRLHAEIIRLEVEGAIAEYYVNDLGSTNGTYLNGTKITGQQLLEDGDKVKVGSHMMKFAMLDEFEAEFHEKLHQISVTATDHVGWQSVAASSFIVDKTPPVIEIKANGVVMNGGESFAADVTLTWTATDLTLDQVTATLDNNPITSGSVVTAEGLHTLVVKATDGAGHTTVATGPGPT